MPESEPHNPEPKPADNSPGSLFSAPTKNLNQIDDQQPIEYLSSKPKKADSPSAIIIAIVPAIVAFWFLFKQIDTYFPKATDFFKTTVAKLNHKKVEKTGDGYDFPEPKAPQDRVPLAKIIIPTPAPKPAAAPAAAPSIPAAQPVPANPVAQLSTALNHMVNPAPAPALESAPQTLNVHGVMANGKTNVALINDQVYQEGDEVDGVKIEKIDMDYITILTNGKEEKVPVKN